MNVEVDRSHQSAAAGPDERAGVLYGFAAYLLWGSFPLFFLLLDRAGPVEILAHRIVWSLVAVAAVLAVGRNARKLLALARDRRKALLLTLAAVLVGLNWGVFIYAVNSEHVIEGSLGYFINPLVSVAFGVLVFHERLRRRQVAALSLGTLAVVVLTLDYGRVPWVALTLAFSFGGYGLVKKLANAGAAESLAFETLVLLAPALGYVIAIEAAGSGSFGHDAPWHALLLAASGPVTAVPLLLFTGAVTRVPLSTIGMLQYITPTLQFLVGLLVRGEAMPASRWVGFALVWAALVILTADMARVASRRPAPV
jgi:chloramphenicol-sensitive protein RarD